MEALRFYGSRNFVAFADIAGQYYCGKPIWTFDEICDVKDYYKSVIALNEVEEEKSGNSDLKSFRGRS